MSLRYTRFQLLSDVYRGIAWLRVLMGVGLLTACQPPRQPAIEVTSEVPAAKPRTDIGAVGGRVILNGQPVTHFGLALSANGTRISRAKVKVIESDTGEFTLRGVRAPGVWDLVVVGQGFERKVVTGIHVDIGKIKSLGTIEVSLGESIEGVVVDSQGAPVGEASVRVVRDWDYDEDEMTDLLLGNSRSASDSNGRFVIEGIGRSENPARSIYAKLPDVGISFVEHVSQNQPVRLVLFPSGSVRGTVEGQRTARVMAISVTNTHHHATTKVIDGINSYNLELPIGTYLLYPISGKSYPQVQLTILQGTTIEQNFIPQP